MIHYVFYFISILLILSSIGVVAFKNPIYNVLSLIVTFFGLTSHYILMKASFIGIINIIVYAGSIMVLFLFVIMFLNLNKGIRHSNKQIIKKISVVALTGFIMIMLVSILKHNSEAYIYSDTYNIGQVKELGKTLFKDYKFPFLLIAVLLLLATIGAVLLSTKNSTTNKISQVDDDTTRI
ncbi:MAG: NADH-quinone oxidoreductase subunit J family protein [Solitalea-like symbiont of Acarus siro]